MGMGWAAAGQVSPVSTEVKTIPWHKPYWISQHLLMLFSQVSVVAMKGHIEYLLSFVPYSY
jgi:hypothetical protein